MKVCVNECFELKGDYQNQFLGDEVFPQPKYQKIKCSERSVNKVHYNNVYILEPLHYYYVTLSEKIETTLEVNNIFYHNGLILKLDYENNRIYIFNASQNIVYLQKGTKIGEVNVHG